MESHRSRKYKAKDRITRRQNYIICVKAGGQNWQVWKEYKDSYLLVRKDWNKPDATTRIKH